MYIYMYGTNSIFEKKNDLLSIVVYYYTYLKTNKIIGKCHIKVNRLYSIQVDRVDIILNVLLLTGLYMYIVYFKSRPFHL
jgi:hypothetical protein